MFTNEEIEIIRECLTFGLYNVKEYKGYPSKEFKNERIEEIKNVLDKVNNRLL